MLGRGIQRLLTSREHEPFADGLPQTVEIAVPEVARERAEEIVQLSRHYSDYAAGFGSPREVLGPALLYGLAHMHARYTAAVIERHAA